MYPFYVLDLPHDVTDAQVEARYHELVARYPPDRAPAQFQLVRRAYEALTTKDKRLSTMLFYLDDPHLMFERLDTMATLQDVRRLSPDELSRVLLEASEV